MLTDADSALEFIEAFAEFARRIGKHGRAVIHVRFGLDMVLAVAG